MYFKDTLWLKGDDTVVVVVVVEIVVDRPTVVESRYV
mgnify:CR=1 FL=1